MHSEERYVCTSCGNSYCWNEVVEDDSGIGINCPSCGGGCDPAEHECVGCGKDSFSRTPHSWVLVDDDWCPLCEECSAIELASSDSLIRCNKCHRILDRLMLPKNGCIMCMLDDISKVIRQINIAVLNKLNKVIEHNKNTKGEHND